MKVVVTGATGLIGRALVPELRAAGHTVLTVTRRPAGGADEIAWDPAAGQLDRAALAGVEAAVHLAGENLDAQRWSPEHLQRVRNSRVEGTALLARTLAELAPRPRTLVAVSATGVYGDRGDQVLDDNAKPGLGVMADIVKAWEAAAAPAERAGIRVAQPRFGMVLTARGGAIARMMLPARLGLLGPVGDGRQWWSWITLRDVARVIVACLDDPRLAGPFNAVTPAAVRQRAFARAFGHVLHRPAVVPAPALLMRLLFGGITDELLLGSQRVIPGRLSAIGFTFADPQLEPAIRWAIADRA
jgi:uncharacterized protein (TIGR01777 family)